MNQTIETSNNAKKSPRRRGRIVLWSTALVGALVLSTAAFAGRPHGPPGGGPGLMHGMKLMRLVHDLDLTEEQEIKALRIRRELKKEAEGMKQERKELMQTAIDELGKKNPDPTKLHGVVDRAMARANKLAHKAIDQFLELHAMLSDSQRAELVRHAEEMKEHAGQRGPRRGRK